MVQQGSVGEHHISLPLSNSSSVVGSLRLSVELAL
jgi:hypothetical protein